jgi:lipid-A-disaccharide synthase
MKYFIIAGEASGDLHGSNLMRELKEKDPSAEFRFLGGDLMASVGGTPLIHYSRMAFMGIVPVVMHLRSILGNMRLCRKALQEFAPDALILIDYPSFNLRIASFAKKTLRLTVYYYISPKLWAWKEYRIKQMKEYVDHIFCIFPFETAFYRKHNYTAATYVGNPTLDALEMRDCRDETFAAFISRNNLTDKPVVALLAGSRKKEIADNLPVMLSAAASFPGYQFIVAGAPGINPSYYGQYTQGTNLTVLFGQTYAVLQHAKAALVTSGTATLETCLLNIPQVVTYRVKYGRIVLILRKLLIRIPYFSLVNIIAGKEVVKEFLGMQVTTQSLTGELNSLLHDEQIRKTMLDNYAAIRQTLGSTGASSKAAGEITDLLKSSKNIDRAEKA